MNILIIKNINHRNSGWSYITNQIKKILSLEHVISILDLPYTSVYSSSYFFYTYKNIELKNKYDLIICCEGKPSKKWLKSGKILWIPMQEFLSGGPWKNICTENWFSVYSTSQNLYNKLKEFNPNLDLEYFQYWSEPINLERKIQNDKLNLFIHFRTRNWGNKFWINLLQKLEKYDFEYTIKVDNHSDLSIKDIRLGHVKKLILGQLEDRNDYIQALHESDIYFAPRLIEGLGLCSQEACQLGNVLIYPDSSTHNEYFNSENGLKLEIISKSGSKNIMGERKDLYIQKDQEDRVVEYLDDLDKNRNKLYQIQNYNQEYCQKKYEEFVSIFRQYINRFEKKELIFIKNKPKIVHIQFCLEGGQGLISTNIASDLQRYNVSDNEFYYLSDNDKAKNIYLKKLGSIKNEKLENSKELEADIVFIHWSSTAQKRISNYQEWIEFIKLLNIPKVGLIYDSVEVMPEICDYYCVPSSFNLDFIPCNSKKTFIVPYQVEDYFYQINNKDNVKNYKTTPFVIGRVSRLIERKFNKKFIPIVKYLHNKYLNISLHIIGEGDYKSELENEIKKYEIPYKIEALYGEKRKEVMRNFDLCLYLTEEHQESFCLSVAECMSLGIPIVCEDKGALSEIVGIQELAGRDLHQIVDISEKIISNLDYRKDISRKMKDQAKNYKSEIIIDKYKDMISFILEMV